MKDIFICSRGSVARKTSKFGITHILSLLDPGVKPFLHPKFDRTNWKILYFEDDLREFSPFAPTKEHIEKIIEWGRNLPDDAVVLIHCEAGMSRSTAGALILMTLRWGIERIDEHCELLVEKRPIACPNNLMTRYADELLNVNGVFNAAAEKVRNKFIERFKIP